MVCPKNRWFSPFPIKNEMKGNISGLENENSKMSPKLSTQAFANEINIKQGGCLDSI